MLVYDGTIDSTEAERYWQDFAHPPEVVVQQQGQDLAGARVLVYTRNGEGYVHDNIAASVAAIEGLGERYGFTVVATEGSEGLYPGAASRFRRAGVCQYEQ